MKPVKSVSLCLLLLLMLAPMLASGAGLGRIKVNSGLGEPLSADIELLETSPGEAATLVAKLATSDEYSAAGLEDVIVPQGVHIAPATKADGTPVLHITTGKPINDPFLELLIHVDSETVHLVRQYTLLLDPPLSKLAEEPASPPSPSAKKNAVAQSAGDEIPPPPRHKRAAKPVTATPVQETAVSQKPDRQQSNAAPAGNTATPVEVTGETYITQSGDIFGKVAQRYQPDGVRLKKVMAAFYAANPDAFLNGDINQLKADQVLKIPSPESMGAARPQSASAPPEPKPENPVKENTKPSVAKGAVATPPDSSKFVLQISPGDTGGPEDNKSEPPDASSNAVENGQNTPANAAAPNPVDPSVEAEATPTPAPDIKPATTAIQPKPSLAEQVNAGQPDFADSMLDRLIWMGAGVLLSLLVAGFVYYLHLRRLAAMRRLQDEALFPVAAEDHDGEEDDFFKPAKSKKSPQTIEQDTAEMNAFAETQILDSAQAHGNNKQGNDFDIHEVDPLVEAEIYMSYGRDEQAENILIHALERHPERHELSMALLRVYAERPDPVAFERTALKIREAAESGIESEADWGKAALMGRQIDPENPLYAIEDIQDETLDADVETQVLEVGNFTDDAGSPEETLFAPNEPVTDTEIVSPELSQIEPLHPSLSNEPLRPIMESNVLEFTFEDIAPSERVSKEQESEEPLLDENSLQSGWGDKDDNDGNTVSFDNLGLDELFPPEQRGQESEQQKRARPKKNRPA